MTELGEWIVSHWVLFLLLEHEGLDHVDDPESSFDCGCVAFVFMEDVSWVEVGSDNDVHWSDESHLSELVFCLEWLVLSPLLEVAKHERFILLDVIDEDGWLVSVTIPVLGFALLVDLAVVLAFPSFGGLPDSGLSPIPGISILK